ncbi:hypothetical protein [Pseudomonas paeninsulae]|uniref:hypothetical protein n=1 Tax=Pseudomonas paeninsulae TaxID=3110772 RepID=UPI002D7A1F61|nr:hypothetical protein [Pseudomonas sp. IT1137]
MSGIEFYAPGDYGNPFAGTDRSRTISALYIAQGDVGNLSKKEMRRDVLTKLMSPSAVNYWLNEKGWLEKTRKIGRIQLLRLTTSGLSTCSISIGGLGTSQANNEISEWRRKIKYGAPLFKKVHFAQLEDPELKI